MTKMTVRCGGSAEVRIYFDHSAFAMRGADLRNFAAKNCRTAEATVNSRFNFADLTNQWRN